jgi:RNA polymerase sigma-70 factor (ECF subfamily)
MPGSAETSGDPIPTDPGASQTDWAVIYDAAHGDEEPARRAWDTLARRYWPAIYAYVRSSGQDVHAAADMTQQFFGDVILGRGLVAAADPERGRFRTFLLTALRNFMVERHRHATRRKRAPEGQTGSHLIELDRDDLPDVQPRDSDTPESAFNMQWSVGIVRRVLDRVRRECMDEELASHWAVFEARVARPMLMGDEPTPYSILVDTLDLRDAGQAANMMITVKRRFASVLHEEVGDTVAAPGEVAEELHALMRALERPGRSGKGR